MVIKTVFELPELDIKLQQQDGRKKLFTITYGKHTSRGLSYRQAANELGLCLLHSLACSDKLDNGGL